LFDGSDGRENLTPESFTWNHPGSNPNRDLNFWLVKGETNSVAKRSNASIPEKLELSQNYPNPFNPVTQINFSLKYAGHVKLEVYNTLGQRVKTLVDKGMSAGNHVVNFSASGLSSGEYIYRIEATGTNGERFTQMRKMILMK
jgi:hypothetical protein